MLQGTYLNPRVEKQNMYESNDGCKFMRQIGKTAWRTSPSLSPGASPSPGDCRSLQLRHWRQQGQDDFPHESLLPGQVGIQLANHQQQSGEEGFSAQMCATNRIINNER